MNTGKHHWDATGTAAITERILGCAFRVHNVLGCGFLEKPYENAMVHEMRKTGLFVEQQFAIPIRYDGVVVGDYVGDIRVEKQVIVELKVVKALDEVHEAICLNYVRATELHVCLLINFAKPRLEFRRLVRD